jgi:hygromycin-B 4-O-kinase
MNALADIEIIELARLALGEKPTGFEFLGSGMFSRAYLLNFGGEKLVLRIGSNYTPFLKDDWAANVLKGTDIPVAEVFAKGPIGEYFFCFTAFKEGTRFDKLETPEIKSLLPSLFELHQKIAAIELPSNRNFGFLDPSGHGIYDSWKDALTNFGDWPTQILSRKGEQFLDWDRIFNETILDEKLARESMARINALLQYCPERRGLIHGDFGFDNMLVGHGRISAVLDWAESRCGDPLYDIASMQCHGSNVNYREAYKEWLVNKNLLPSNFDERMDCYMVHILFCSCWLDAQRGFEDYYDEGRKVLETLL